MAASSYGNVEPIPAEIAFLSALGLMKITTEETTVTSVPLSKSRCTDTDKSAGGSHTSASDELILPYKKRSQFKSVAASSTAKKTFVVKKAHVSKRVDRAKKRSHATSFDEPKSIPAVVSVKKVRKPAARATGKPTISKEPKDVKDQQHKASPPATKVSSSAPESNVTIAEKISKVGCAKDKLRFWENILESDFKSMEYTMLLKNGKFTEEQTQAIQKSFQYLCRSFLRRPTKHQRCMKRHECLECNFSIPHECVAINKVEYWTFGGNAPCIDFITPEYITMCLCNFTVFHSHTKPKPKRQARSKQARQAISLEPSPLPSTTPLHENNRTVNFSCPKCCMMVSITNRNNDVCSTLINFVSTDNRIRKNFFRYVCEYLDYAPKKYPTMMEFYSCYNLCCMLFHRCAEDVIVRNSMPIQPHQPFLRCHPKE